MRKTTQAFLAFVEAFREDTPELNGTARQLALMIRDGVDLLQCDEDSDTFDATAIALLMEDILQELGA